MRRRDFITLLGGAAAAMPLAARAQQARMPVIGYLSARTAKSEAALLTAFRQGLGASGFVEGQNVAVEYRFADGRYDQLPAMAADLVRRQVAVIFSAGGTQTAAKAATSTIPIVFSTAGDPVEAGIVASFNRPGGNLTGVSNISADVTPKRLQLMHDLIPAARIIGLLINPSIRIPLPSLNTMQGAAANLGIELPILEASSEPDFEKVFSRLGELRAGALFISADAYFTSRMDQIAGLALRHGMPASYQFREFPAAGGLMSYGGDIAAGYRVAGSYVGRVLKGEKPADLPIQQTTRVELVLNLNTAKALGLEVPTQMLALADDVIE
jgi:putative ABC transport system substrate-binding protein